MNCGSRLLQDVEYPVVVDARICGGPDSCGAHATCAKAVVSTSKDVIRHLPGRDASLSRVYATDGGPLQAKSHRCGENLAITITYVNGRNASSDLTIRPLLSTSEDLGMETILLAKICAKVAPPSHICLYALNKN